MEELITGVLRAQFPRCLATEVIWSFCSTGSSQLNDVVIGKRRTNESYSLSAHAKWCHLAAEESNQNPPGFSTPNLSIGNVIKLRMKLYSGCVSYMKGERVFLSTSIARRVHKSALIPCVHWVFWFCLFAKLIVINYMRSWLMKEHWSREHYLMRKSYIIWDITPCSLSKTNRRFGVTCHIHLLDNCFRLVSCLV
jgi:hypothetical protein